MVRCSELYEKVSREGTDWCKKAPQTAARITKFLEEIWPELEKEIANSEILGPENCPIGQVLSEGASCPLISIKDPELRSEVLNQIVKVAEEKLMDGVKPQVTEKEVTRIIEDIHAEEEDDEYEDEIDIRDMTFEEIHELEQACGYRFGQNLELDSNLEPYKAKLAEPKENRKSLGEAPVVKGQKVDLKALLNEDPNLWKRSLLRSQIDAIEYLLEEEVCEYKLYDSYFHIFAPNFEMEDRLKIDDITAHLEERDRLRVDSWNNLGLPLQVPYIKEFCEKRSIPGLYVHPIESKDGLTMEKLEEYRAWKATVRTT